VERTVPCVTTTAVPYTEIEWLQADRTWTRSRNAAVSFEQTPTAALEVRDLVAGLQTDPADAAQMASVRAVLTSPVVEPSDGVPPDAIRDHGHAWQRPGR
jgi:hypothetical protein